MAVQPRGMMGALGHDIGPNQLFFAVVIRLQIDDEILHLHGVKRYAAAVVGQTEYADSEKDPPKGASLNKSSAQRGGGGSHSTAAHGGANTVTTPSSAPGWSA